MSSVWGLPVNTKQGHKQQYLSVIAAVNSGRMNEREGGETLKRMGFPDKDNPFTHGPESALHQIGEAAHVIAKPVGLSRSENIRKTKAAQDAFVAEHGRLPTVDEIKPQAGTVSVFPGAMSLLGQTGAGIAQGLVNNPGGFAALAEDPGGTLRSIGHNVGETVHDPLGHPGNALLLGSALLAGGGAGLARGVGAVGALRSGAGVRAAVTRSGAEGGSLLHTPEPGHAAIHVPGSRPEVVPGKDVGHFYNQVGDYLPSHLAERSNLTVHNIHDHNGNIIGSMTFDARPGRKNIYVESIFIRPEVRNAANLKKLVAPVLEDGRPFEADIANPRLKGVLDRVAARRNVGDKIKLSDQPAIKRGEVPPQMPALHGPPTGLAEGPVPATTVFRPLSRNVPYRTLWQKPRVARVQRALDKGPSAARTKVGGRIQRSNVNRALRGTFSAPTTVGRERRAGLRVEAGKTAALRHQLATTINTDWKGRGLSQGEHAALGVLGVEGKDAFTNTDEVIDRHIAAHEHWANLGGDADGNHAARITDLEQARQVLKNPRPRFTRAAALTKQLADRTEGDLIDAGLLTREIAQGRKEKIAQTYGRDTTPDDGFFFSLHNRYRFNEPLHTPSTVGGGKGGKYGLGPVSASQHVGGLGKKFTGESIASGHIPVNVAATVLDRDTRVQRLLQAQRQYEELWRVSHPERRSQFDIPIRDTKEIRDDLRQFFGEIAGHLHTNPDEMIALDTEQLVELLRKIEVRDTGGVGPASRMEGVRYIDRRMLANMGENSPRNIIEKVADAVTNPVRSADLYLRPAYVLNLLGNAGMAGITQGGAVIPSLRKAVLSNTKYGREETAAIDSLMEASRSRSYSVPTGFGHHANEVLAHAWNDITDLYFRRSAFYHEAARAAGARSPAEISDLLTNPKMRTKLEEVVRRANKNAVDYRMTPVEAQTIRRLIYFYPWVSRATIWSLRTLMENPGKVFTLAQLGQVGAEKAHKAFGPLPPWLKDLGLIPVGNRKGFIQKVINPASINTYTTMSQAGRTAIDTTRALIGLSHGEALSGSLTPAWSLFTQAATPSEGQIGQTGAIGLAESLPFVRAIRTGLGHGSKTYPDTGLLPAGLPYAIGGLAPRGLDVVQSGKQAEGALPAGLPKIHAQLSRAINLGLIDKHYAQQVYDYAKTLSAADRTTLLSRISSRLNAMTKAATATP